MERREEHSGNVEKIERRIERRRRRSRDVKAEAEVRKIVEALKRRVGPEKAKQREQHKKIRRKQHMKESQRSLRARRTARGRQTTEEDCQDARRTLEQQDKG